MPQHIANDVRITRTLRTAFTKLGRVVLLSEYVEFCQDWAKRKNALKLKDRQLILEQARIVLEQAYVHLPLKQVVHAITPLAQLRQLEHELTQLDEWQFHQEVLKIFKGLRDIHTTYFLPKPYSSYIALLPFLVEPYFDLKTRRSRFLVTRLFGADSYRSRFRLSRFRPGAEITLWNGMPMETAVWVNAERENGSNHDASFAEAVQFMTVRWLGASLPPQAQHVVLGYKDENGRVDEIRFPWCALELEEGANFAISPQAIWALEEADSAHLSSSRLNSCMNPRSHLEHLVRQQLFSRRKFSRYRDRITVQHRGRVQADGLVQQDVPSEILDRFEAKILENQWGYVRIRAFETNDVDGFVGEFRRLLRQLPHLGLIIDIRSNPGGAIQAAEGLLQLLTPKTITPLPFQFVSSDLTERLTTRSKKPKLVKLPTRGSVTDAFAGVHRYRERFDLNAYWGKSVALAQRTGAPYSGSVPLTLPDFANAIGQEYFGPVVLITDARSYSAADMFAAGFQDHAIGTVIGIDSTTGAGGANLWQHEQLVSLLGDEPNALHSLPAGRIQFAVRRCTRTGPNTGVPVENIGVKTNVRHRTTRNDVLYQNADLLKCAITELEKLRRKLKLKPGEIRELDVTALAHDENSVSLSVKARGMDSIDVYVDDRPKDFFSLKKTGKTLRQVPANPGACLKLYGFSKGQLVALRKLTAPNFG